MKKLILIILVFSAGVNLSFSQGTSQKPRISKPVYFDVSPPLREMVANVYGPDRPLNKIKEIKNEFDLDLEYPGANHVFPVADPGLQDYFGMLPSDTTIQNFNGTGNISGSVPPDTHGEAGPNEFFQVVNLCYTIYNKTGEVAFGPYPNSSIWTGFPNNDNGGDAVVHYDENANRWLFTQFSLPSYPAGPFFQMIAISQTPDPTGPWYRYQYEFDLMPDYPKFGIWPDGYYMSANLFGMAGFMGNGAYAFDRQAMLAGDSNAIMIAFTPSAGGFVTLYPSDCDGPFPPVGTPNYYGYIRTNSPQHFGIYEFHADFANPGASWFGNLTQLTVDPFTRLQQGIPQKNTNIKLETLGDRLMYRLQFRDFGSYFTMVVNHSVDVGGNVSGVRWYEFRKTTGPWTVYQQSTFAPDNNSRWMGSIAMDTAGTIGLGYSISSADMFPSIRYTGRHKNDPLNQMTFAEKTIVDGGGCQTGIWSGRSRWGDYSGMSVDPVNPTTFWFTTEYYSSTNTSSWMTRIGAFTFDNNFSTMASSYPQMVCLGDSSQLNIHAYGGPSTSYSYSWTSIPAGFTSNLPDPKVAPTDTTKYVITTTNGSQVRHDTVSVKVIFPPTAFAGNDTTICDWLSAMQMDGIATNYKLVGWGTTGDGHFDNMYDLNTIYHIGPEDYQNGTFDLMLAVFAKNPCHGMLISTRHVTIDVCTGIKDPASGGLAMAVIPNPAHGNVTLNIEGLKKSAGKLFITGMEGKTVHTDIIAPSPDPVGLNVDISGYAPGIYIIRVASDEGTLIKKLIVQ